MYIYAINVSASVSESLPIKLKYLLIGICITKTLRMERIYSVASKRNTMLFFGILQNTGAVYIPSDSFYQPTSNICVYIGSCGCESKWLFLVIIPTTCVIKRCKQFNFFRRAAYTKDIYQWRNILSTYKIL